MSGLLFKNKMTKKDYIIIASMNNITYTVIQREKRQKEIRDKVKRFVKVAGYWVGLVLLACLIAPICWVLMVGLLCL